MPNEVITLDDSDDDIEMIPQEQTPNRNRSDKPRSSSVSSGAEIARLMSRNFDEEMEPLFIKDYEYTAEKPTRSRRVLVNLLNSLAKQVFEMLEKDSKDQQRDVRRIQITSRAEGSSRDWLEMKLPHTAISWNDLDQDEIEFYFIESLMDVAEDYPWFHVFLKLDYFLPHKVRLLIEEMEAEEDDEEGSESEIPQQEDEEVDN